MEGLKNFTERFCNSVGCYNHPISQGWYSLKKHNSDTHGDMGVFGWTRELKRKGVFEVSTYKEYANSADIRRYDDYKPTLAHGKPWVAFYVKKDNIEEDYESVVEIFKSILQFV